MAKGFASIGDKLADKKIPCRVRGCPRSWLWRGHDQAKAFAAGNTTPPQRMCDLCHARSETMEDQVVSCATNGCEGSFVWTKLAQLEAILKSTGDGPPQPPRFLCEACLGKAKTLGDKAVPCRVKGCTNTWLWSGKAQLAAGESAEPPSRMCDSCHHTFEGLRDESRPCKVRGCNRRWTWTKWQRLEAGLAHKDEPPDRMCDECAKIVRSLQDEEVPCRTDGCGGKWTWTRLQKREAELAGETTPPPRMCPQCQSKFSQLKDITVACKRAGCKNSWIWKRGAQLERWVKHHEGPDHAPPHRLCEHCRKGLDDFKDREVRCKNEGCKSTWTWTRFAQMQARETGHGGEPPHHMCEECRDFLKDHHTKTLVCTECGAETHWAPELQLKTKLGLMKEPTLCASCKRKSTESLRHAHRNV